MTHKPSNKANEVCRSIQSLDGTTELFSCFIASLRFHHVNSPGHNMVYIYGPADFTLHKKVMMTNEKMPKHVDVTLEVMKKHCFVPPQAVRHQCHDEVLHSPVAGPQ